MNTNYNKASSKVELVPDDRTFFESTAIDQLELAARLSGVREVYGYPDLHPGKGIAVGSSIVADGFIYPFLIGGDIGCGIGLWQTKLKRRKAKLDRIAKRLFGLESADSEIEKGSMPFAEAMGTIGGGNHFAELQRIEKIYDEEAYERSSLEKDNLCLLVHSGSRGYGNSILKAHVERHRDRGLKRSDSECGDYMRKHADAVEWAALNRAEIARRVGRMIGADTTKISDVPHNLIEAKAHEGKTVFVHRKGAAAADRGLVVVAGSRGTLSYLVEPINACRKWGWSLSHGAGRKWQRSDSYARMRDRFRKEQLIQTELGGRVICEDKRLLFEEAPQVFKNIDTVVAHLVDAGLVRVVASLRPLLTYKVRKEASRR